MLLLAPALCDIVKEMCIATKQTAWAELCMMLNAERHFAALPRTVLPNADIAACLKLFQEHPVNLALSAHWLQASPVLCDS